MVLTMKHREFLEIIVPSVALTIQIAKAIAQAIAEIIAGIINAGMGV